MRGGGIKLFKYWSYFVGLVVEINNNVWYGCLYYVGRKGKIIEYLYLVIYDYVVSDEIGDIIYFKEYELILLKGGLVYV